MASCHSQGTLTGEEKVSKNDSDEKDLGKRDEKDEKDRDRGQEKSVEGKMGKQSARLYSLGFNTYMGGCRVSCREPGGIRSHQRIHGAVAVLRRQSTL